MQYTTLFPRAHQIEREVAVRDHGSGKFSCVIPLCLQPSSDTMFVLFVKSLHLLIIVISSEANQKIGHNLCKMHYLVVASV